MCHEYLSLVELNNGCRVVAMSAMSVVAIPRYK